MGLTKTSMSRRGGGMLARSPGFSVERKTPSTKRPLTAMLALPPSSAKSRSPESGVNSVAVKRSLKRGPKSSLSPPFKFARPSIIAVEKPSMLPLASTLPNGQTFFGSIGPCNVASISSAPGGSATTRPPACAWIASPGRARTVATRSRNSNGVPTRRVSGSDHESLRDLTSRSSSSLDSHSIGSNDFFSAAPPGRLGGSFSRGSSARWRFVTP